MGEMMDFVTGWGVALVLLVVLLIDAIAGVVLLAFRGASVRSRNRHLDALDVLDDRFAWGEIDRDEYEARRQTLRR